MRYLFSALSLLLLVVFFDIPALINRNDIVNSNSSIIAATSPTSISNMSNDQVDSTPSAESTPSSDLTPTQTPTPTLVNSANSNENNNGQGGNSQVAIPHPSVPIVITPFVENSNRVLEKYYNPFSPTGLVELFNPHNFYTESIYSPYVKIIMILFSLILFFWGIQLIDKSKIELLQNFRNRIFVKKERDKKLLQHYYEG